ncbi:hypothetical protein POVCU1_077290 [Plasmodium ovale curtisi]|uniref:Uncharacterized protein n=1 Tax=Plasmodium ovale curtisi TaxID=864141 RepID=A0A1A8XF20_PLAOA|nr:hypothetical protein POVCU1_077290 [Plasmodium ovale curtisi]
MGKCLPSPCKTITNDSHNKIVNSSEGVEPNAGKKRRGEEETRGRRNEGKKQRGNAIGQLHFLYFIFFKKEELHICSESDRYMDGNSQYTGRLED